MKEGRMQGDGGRRKREWRNKKEGSNMSPENEK